MWLPTPIYESLPYVTLIAGSACVVGASNLLMVVSGLLLFLSGGVIWKLRHDYRTANRLIEIQRARSASRCRRSQRGVAQVSVEVEDL